ncbi:MAG: sigma-70 family RNA polymerase sigma factor [Planctomycetota bacterium]|jgi:RNA polymerase sigma-70 factor (ECF subfamily)
MEQTELPEWAKEFQSMRPRLERIVTFRMDRNVAQRLDPSDVIQESFFEIERRLEEYHRDPTVPFFVWVRQRVLQTMIDMQRGHWRDKRSVGREQDMDGTNNQGSTSMSIVHWMMDDMTSPSQAAIKHEEVEQLQRSLDQMSETDREILAMRHFEHLSNAEVAQVLAISPTAASNRYIRAAARLAELLKRYTT